MERKPEILIVDDDTDLASNLQDILETEGYSTAVAYDGQTALTLCHEKVFDMALVDIKLPNISGIKLIDNLAEVLPAAEYIVIIGHASLDSAVEAVRQSNIVAYITKPLNMDEVLARIRDTLEKQRLIIENRRLLETIQQELVERKRAERALKESEEHFRNLMEQSPIAIQIMTPEGQIYQVNEAYEKLWGITLEDLSDYNILQDEQAREIGLMPYIEKAFVGEISPLLEFE